MCELYKQFCGKLEKKKANNHPIYGDDTKKRSAKMVILFDG